MATARRSKLVNLLFPEETAPSVPIIRPYSSGIEPKDYGEIIASRKRTHKQYLRKHHLGKFRKK